MSKCLFVQDSADTVPGTTAYAEKKNAFLRDTGVYFPPNHSFSNTNLNVILWMHGYYVHSAPDLFHAGKTENETGLRESILKSKKDVVLIAPWLGLKVSRNEGKIDLAALGTGAGAQTYLEGVLEGLRDFQNSLAKKKNLAPVAKLQIANLIVAGHSAGGAKMREVVKHLGAFKEGGTLKECWGFDCFYDDENTWGPWARGLPAVKKFLYFGNGSNGADSFGFMKYVQGTPKNPVPKANAIPNLRLAPAIKGHLTANDAIAFQTVEDILKKAPDTNSPLGRLQVAARNWYDQVRLNTDVFLDDQTAKRYWAQIWTKLMEHFAVVRELFAPRVLAAFRAQATAP